MPTLLLIDGFRFYFHSREGNEPPHVHVRKAEANAKFWLHPIALAFTDGYSPSQLTRIRELTFEHQAFFIERWHEYFGDQP